MKHFSWSDNYTSRSKDTSSRCVKLSLLKHKVPLRLLSVCVYLGGTQIMCIVCESLTL